jgi:hypothetical protein
MIARTAKQVAILPEIEDRLSPKTLDRPARPRNQPPSQRQRLFMFFLLLLPEKLF